MKKEMALSLSILVATISFWQQTNAGGRDISAAILGAANGVLWSTIHNGITNRMDSGTLGHIE